MESLVVNYGVELAIYSKKTSKFMRYDPESRKVKADSIHPFLKVVRSQKANSRETGTVCLEEFTIYNEKDPSIRGPLTYGSHVYLINKNGYYLLVDDKGVASCVKMPEINNANYLQYSTWSIQQRESVSTRKSVLVTDTIIFKSCLGNFLRIEDGDKVLADSSIPSDRCQWHFCKARVPFIPNWARIKPYVSASYLTPSLNTVKPTEDTAKKTRDSRLETTTGQERVLIQELLYVLLSVEGKYIKRKEDPMNNRYFYVIDNDSHLDGSLVLMVSKILPLAELHDKIMIFIQKYSSFDSGTVFQALANAVKSIRRDYVAAINMLDQDFQKGHFTLQRLWYETQKPGKIFEYLCKILSDIENTGKESLLTTLYKHLLIATDDEIYKLVYFLLQQSVYPFLEMLGKWIYYGIVDDKFNEFMIIEHKRPDIDFKSDMFDWNDRFSLSSEKFLMSIADKILATGKYLNVIKNYDKATQCSFSTDLIENHELYLQRQDFSECIDKAFDWANKELIRIVVKEKNLIDRLSSLKQYFFMEAGDLFIHFLDTAEIELKKEVRLISPEKLQSLLEMSIRTSSAEKDAFKDDVYCYLATGPYSDIINIYNASLAKTGKDGKPDLSSTTMMISPQPNDLRSKSTTKKGFEFFTLGYEVEWPLNLILSESNMVYYKLIFKNVFSIRFVELQLYNCWQLNMTTKSSDLHRSLTAYCLLLQRMINFVRSVLYSYSCEVIDDHWKTFILNVEHKVKRFDDLLVFHEDFVQGCVRDTMINDAWFSHKVGQILKVCLIVANYAEKYMNKMKTLETWQSMRNTKIVEGMEAEDRSFYVSNLEEIKKMAIENGKMFDYYVEELLNYMNREHHKFEQTFTNLYQRLDFYGYYTKAEYGI